MSIAAQHDNLGDILIRRSVLRIFEQRGYQVYVYVGNMPREYVDAFDFKNSTVLHTDLVRFKFSLFASCLLHKTAFILAPGPFVFTATPKSVLKRLLVVCTLATVRMLGGRIYSFGRSIRGRATALQFMERAIVRLAHIYTVRDNLSENLIGENVGEFPDVGLLEEAMSNSGDRAYVAFSFRYDRPVDVEYIRPLIADCRDSGLVPIFVSQVQRDDAQHKFLAETLGTEILLWGSSTHSSQLLEVEKIYNNAHAVVSDRLHALVLGIVSGSFPVSSDSSDKISSTLFSWFSLARVLDGSSKDGTTLGFGQTERAVLLKELDRARDLAKSQFSEI